MDIKMIEKESVCCENPVLKIDNRTTREILLHEKAMKHLKTIVFESFKERYKEALK